LTSLLGAIKLRWFVRNITLLVTYDGELIPLPSDSGGGE
jgi:hypothetical protein